MMKKRLALALFVLALGVSAVGGSGAQTRTEVTEPFQQTHPLAAGGRVALSNISGKVRITAWDRNEVKIEAVKRAHRAERLRDVEIRVNTAGGGVEIESIYPENYWRGQDHDSNNEDRPPVVDYTLTVPRGARLDEIRLINGPLEIEGVGGSVQASSVNGPVTARNLAGRVRLSVVNGRLDASFDRLGAPVSLSGVNGGIEVHIPSDSVAHLRASTVHGHISNDFQLPVRVGKYVGRNLEGRLGEGGARLELSNVNGTISIRRANDGKQPSAATNLLSEAPDEDFNALDAEVGREVARASREAAREAREAAREATRELREGQGEETRVESRERSEELREAQRELQREQREMEREQREEARERQRELNEAAREIEREAAVVAREATKVAREVSRSVGGNVTVREQTPRQIVRESKSFPATGAARVRLETFDGSIKVHAWDKPEVMYTAVKRAHSDREMQGISILAQAGPEIVVRAEFDKSHAQEVVERSGQVVMFSSGASVELDVFVPRQSALLLSSGDGRLTVEGVTGELELRTGDGPVDVLGGGGSLRVNTGDGPIRVENFDGAADTRTGDGRITLDGRFQQLAARTGDGTISLTLPEGASADIETHATNVSNDGVATAADTSEEGRVRRWRVGAGGQLFTLRTGDGLIILRRR